MTLDPRLLDCSAGPSASRPSQPAHPITTPRLTNLDADATQRLPRATVANLRFPERLVRERAEALVADARRRGAPASLRVWRDAHRLALAALAREACGVGTGVTCTSLFWEHADHLYHVSATFGSSRATVH